MPESTPTAPRRNPRSWFDRPERVLACFIGFSLIAWTLQCSLLQKVLGLDVLETILWGEKMAWGHSKHPPLSGWIGGFFARASGHGDWAMYLAAQLCVCIGIFFAFKVARLFFDRYRATVSTLLLYFLFYYTPSWMKFSTYFVEIALAPAAAYFLLRALRGNRLADWCLLGLLCGLGFLNKYSFGLILLGFALVVLTRADYRRRLASPGPYLAALLCIILFLPHLKWLWENDFVCFQHVDERLEEEHNFLMPLAVLAAALYPMLTEALAVALALLPPFGAVWRKPRALWEKFRSLEGWERCPADREALHFAAILSLTPGAFYLLLSLTGTDIILMWLCSVASCSGVAVMALCPVKADARLLRRITWILAIYIGIIFAATTADATFRTTTSMHLDPHDVISAGEEFWHRHNAEPLRVVVGGLRYAAIFDHYSPRHPLGCESDDDLSVDLCREQIERYGALLIDSKLRDLNPFLNRLETPVEFEECYIAYRSLLGETKSRHLFMAYLPPGAKIRKSADANAEKNGHE